MKRAELLGALGAVSVLLALCFSGCGNAGAENGGGDNGRLGDRESYVERSDVADSRIAESSVSDSDLGDSSDGQAYYWQSEGRSFYPLGLSGSIYGLAASGDTVFVCGVENERLALLAMDYEITEGQCVFGGEREIELPELTDGARAVSLSYGAGRFYLLLTVPGASGDVDNYSVLSFAPDGAMLARVDVSPSGGSAEHILPLDDGGFWLVGVHAISHFTAEGDATEAYTDFNVDFEAPFIINGEVVFQVTDYGESGSYLAVYDAENDRLAPVGTQGDLTAPTAVCQSVTGTALICVGDELMAVNEDFTASQVLNWREVYDAETQYRFVCRLDESVYLLVPRDEDEIFYQMEGVEHGASGELLALSTACVPDERSEIRVAFYGRVTELLGVLERRYAHYSPDHRVECLDYGADEAGLARLMRDVSTGDGIDLVICDGSSIDAHSGFVDLYPFIDADGELSREDFVPQVLAGAESRGELHEIWGGFNISTFAATGALAEMPAPLMLGECQAYLDSTGYDEPLFGDWMTKTTLLAWLTPEMLKTSEGGYDVDNDSVRVLLALCKARPDELDYDSPYISQVLEYTDLQPDYLSHLVTAGAAFRLFDGSDGGESYTLLNCDYQSAYLIPETCADKENAWSFLRLLLTEEHQLKDFDRRRVCYPSNVHALARVLDSYNSDETETVVRRLIESATLRTAEYDKAAAIFAQSVMPYLQGDADADTVLNIAQGKLNIFAAERGD